MPSSAERMIKEIEMRVRPDKDQAASFENLHKISADMAKMLIASPACSRFPQTRWRVWMPPMTN